MLPKNTIKIYNAALELQLTLSNVCKDFKVYDVLNNVGDFKFTLPAKVGTQYPYSSIEEGYVAVFWFNGYHEPDLTADPNYVGVIQKITGPLTVEGGYLRVFEGKHLSEILERRHKTNTRWQAEDASNIALEVADDLGLDDSDVATDTNDVTLTVKTESYMDLLKRLSDYWVDADHQVKKDFTVNSDYGLVWASRPWRTSGVETIAISDYLVSPVVTRDKLAVRNSITVYGAATAPIPNDKDFWTEDSDDLSNNWTLTTGTSLTLDHAYLTPKEGTDAILCQASDVSAPYEQTFKFSRTLNGINLRSINKLNFWYYPGHNIAGGAYTALKVRLLAPDASNYFEMHSDLEILQQWYWASLSLGDSAIYDADENPSGIWDMTGSPNWWSLSTVEWEGTSNGAASGSLLFGLDKLHFYPDRWTSGAVQDATSISAYGQHDAEYTDENLTSNEQCTARAQTLLYQQKDPVVRVDITVAGNTNILVGDQLTLTIPAEGIDADPFDVVSVSHVLQAGKFMTVASCVEGQNVRVLPPRTPQESLVYAVKGLRQVTSNLYSSVVR